MYQHTWSSLSLPEMESLARSIALQIRAGDMITLKGEVGAGKTTFARAFIQALATGATEVTSPTFMLMQSYDVKLADGNMQTLWHLDLYRLKNESEAEALGLQELMGTIILIEWPEIIEKILPKECLEIHFDFAPDSQGRTLHVQGHEAWQSRLKKLE